MTIRKRVKSRKIALFVEGDSERGDARRSTLPDFFHRWLDPQLPAQSLVGITAEKFHGVSNYLDDLAQKVEIFLSGRGANFVIGIVDWLTIFWRLRKLCNEIAAPTNTPA